MADKIKILAICGSPRMSSNSEKVTIEALKAAESTGNVETELVKLAGQNINHCTGCDRCSVEGTEEYPCLSFDDAMTKIYPRMVSADGFIFTSPVYFGSVTSLMKAFIDRLEPLTTGFYWSEGKAEFKRTLQLKPAGAIALGGGRNDGIETALHTLYNVFMYHDMVIVGTQFVGHSDLTSGVGGTVFTENQPNAIDRDRGGMSTVRVLGKKVAILARVLKTERSTLEKEYRTHLK